MKISVKYGVEGKNSLDFEDNFSAHVAQFLLNSQIPKDKRASVLKKPFLRNTFNRNNIARFMKVRVEHFKKVAVVKKKGKLVFLLLPPHF